MDEIQILEAITGLSDDGINTMVNYMVGVVAYRIERAGMNISYPPVPETFPLNTLRNSVITFESHVQRQIEYIRRH